MKIGGDVVSDMKLQKRGIVCHVWISFWSLNKPRNKFTQKLNAGEKPVAPTLFFPNQECQRRTFVLAMTVPPPVREPGGLITRVTKSSRGVFPSFGENTFRKRLMLSSVLLHTVLLSTLCWTH